LQNCGKSLKASDFKALLDYVRVMARGEFMGLAYPGTDPSGNYLSEAGDPAGWYVAVVAAEYPFFGLTVEAWEKNGNVVVLMPVDGVYTKVLLPASDFNQENVDHQIDVANPLNNRTDHCPSSRTFAETLAGWGGGGYVRGPVDYIEELYILYPGGGNRGDFSLVYKAHGDEAGIAYWDPSRHEWRLINDGSGHLVVMPREIEFDSRTGSGDIEIKTSLQWWITEGSVQASN
jgi:hypothetical protein